MTKEELKIHIETRYSECSKRSQGLSYGSFYDGYMDCYTEFEKENAELKEKLKPENCLKLLAKDGYVKDTSDQLTKAKEIIRDLLSWEERADYDYNEYDDIKRKAENILKE